MTPRLPTELLTYILALACLDEPALARRRTRDAFSAVCWDWCRSVDRVAEIAVNGVDELSRVVSWLSGGCKRPLGSEAGQKIRSVHVKLTNPAGWKREKPEQPRELNRLLRLVDEVELLELELSNDVLSTKRLEQGNLSRLAPRSVAHLTNLKSLSIVGVSYSSKLTLDSEEFEE
jgi:DNA polymerase III psi subunit